MKERRVQFFGVAAFSALLQTIAGTGYQKRASGLIQRRILDRAFDVLASLPGGLGGGKHPPNQHLASTCGWLCTLVLIGALMCVG